MLEEDIAVFVGTAHNRLLRIQSTLTECLNSIHIAHFLEILIIPDRDLLNLVRGTETVKEVDERNAALDRSEMCNSSQVHDLLRVGLCEHCETGLTAGINVGVVTEDVQCVGSDAASGYVEYAGQQLTGNLVHIRDHQEKALRSGVGGGQCTGIQGAVNRTRSTCLRLHLLNLNGCTKDVLDTLCGPLVNVVCHRAGRRDRIDTGDFREGVGHICSSIVAVHRLLLTNDSHKNVPPLLYNSIWAFIRIPQRNPRRCRISLIYYTTNRAECKAVSLIFDDFSRIRRIPASGALSLLLNLCILICKIWLISRKSWKDPEKVKKWLTVFRFCCIIKAVK